ncbi:uncharacterized protein LOC118745729 [Rhagoletis pomonella]|uniref:uncharacterized protein LOC118745729 n=1 Tax=Rhagoletis pomonella TaxID=28610 RepID=UPI001784202D|nr:uncharacterized protein LOC118745729 [Rhagoletis pomonella]
MVKEYFEHDDISSLMPGQKDKKSVKIDGKSVIFQKRLVLGTLKEIYSKFLKDNPNVAIGLSKFCSLRPPHCILAGSGGTHNVCTCPIHENIKLMTLGSNLVLLMKKEEYPVVNYEDVIMLSLCPNPKEECFFNMCKECSISKTLEGLISAIFQKYEINEVTYKNWNSQPRTTLKTICISTETFIQNYCLASETFLMHSFIAKEQANYYKTLKNNLEIDQCLVTCDFAENYAFIVQNAVTGFHWNNDQATIFPIVFYYNDGGKINHQTLIFISDCKKHDSVAVYVFLKSFNEWLSRFNANIRKCIYFSDGAPQQFKNVKHFTTIYNHENDWPICGMALSCHCPWKSSMRWSRGSFKKKSKES